MFKQGTHGVMRSVRMTDEIEIPGGKGEPFKKGGNRKGKERGHMRFGLVLKGLRVVGDALRWLWAVPEPYCNFNCTLM